MVGMWPRICNLTEKSFSARGQMQDLGISGFSGNLAPGRVERHSVWFSSYRERGARLIRAPQAPRSLHGPNAPVILDSALLNPSCLSLTLLLLEQRSHARRAELLSPRPGGPGLRTREKKRHSRRANACMSPARLQHPRAQGHGFH